MHITTAVELAIIVVLIIVNGLLAMSEIAVVSAHKARLHHLANTGDTNAKTALELANSPNEFLSTVQIGISLIGILTGAFSGATVASQLADYLRRIPAIEPYAGPVALGFVVACITYFSLIVGELVPKRLALRAPEDIARSVAVPMRFISQLAKPIVLLVSGSTNLVFRILGIHEPKEPQVTEAEIQVLLEQATEAGVFEESEQEMVASVLGMDNRKVNSIMIPRSDVTWVDVNVGSTELLELLSKSTHSRIVVAEGSLDRVLGIIETKTVMRLHIQAEPIGLRPLIVQPSYVPESFTVLDLLKSFRDTKLHLAFVMDEYGGFQGLATREDVFEAIVGELPALGEPPKWEAFEREDGSWLLDGQIPLAEFKKIFDLDELPGEDQSSFHTLAGFVLFRLERIPSAGGNFVWNDLRFEVVDMDGHRIDKILVSRIVS